MTPTERKEAESGALTGAAQPGGGGPPPDRCVGISAFVFRADGFEDRLNQCRAAMRTATCAHTRRDEKARSRHGDAARHGRGVAVVVSVHLSGAVSVPRERRSARRQATGRPPPP